MKTFVLVGIAAFGLVCSAAGAGALDDSASKVTGARAVQLATVRGADQGAGAWYLIQQAFASRLSACLTTSDGVDIPVRMEPASATEAAEMLLSGGCDAIFVAGERVPAELRGAGFDSIRAVTEIGVPVRVFHFVMRSEDAASSSSLTGAFRQVTGSTEFQEVVGRFATMRVVARER